MRRIFSFRMELFLNQTQNKPILIEETRNKIRVY
jgi:hypothetical protein